MKTLYLELFSTLLAFTIIGLQSQQKTLAWPLNIIKKSLSLLVFYNKALYIKCLVDGMLILKSCYGWKKWQGNKTKVKGQISVLKSNQFIAILIACSLAGYIIGHLYSTYTSASLPYFDALHATLVLATYILLARKKLQAWIIWILANIIYLPVCWHKATYLFLIKYTLYISMACYSYYKWRNEYLIQKKQSSAIG